MNYMDLVKGIGIGMVAGAAVGAAMMPKKKRGARTTTGKIVRTAGQILNDVQDNMGL